MKTKGIRIHDGKDGIVGAELPDILEEVFEGESFHWSILFLEGVADWGRGKALPISTEEEQEINKSKNGLLINWHDLKILAPKYFQIIDLILIGCKDERSLRRYDTDREMYETCDIMIDLFDATFSEVFSKDKSFINRLAAKFKKIEFLESDFQNEWLHK